MPAQQQHTSWTAYTSASNGPIEPGQCVVLEEEGDYYVNATSANRTAAGRNATGIAITGCSGDAQDRAFEVQVIGDVPPLISLLGAGTATTIRVSSAGLLERSSSDVIGYCDADGTAHVCFPLAGISVGGGASAAGAANSVQAHSAAGDGTFQGAAHFSLSEDGYPEHSADRAGGAAQSGDDRYAKSSVARVRSGDGTRDVTVWGHATSSSYEIVFLGSAVEANRPNSILLRAQNFAGMVTYAAGGAVSQSWNGITAPGATGFTGGAANAKGAIVGPNAWIAANAVSTRTTDPWSGAIGIEYHEDQVTVPSSAPTGGYYRRSNPSNHHPEVLLPGDDPSTGWRDLLDGGNEGEFATVTTAGLITPDVTTDGIRTIKFAPTHDPESEGVDTAINGFVSPPAGESRHVTVILAPQGTADSVTIFEDNGDVAANGVLLSLDTSLSVTYPEIKTVTLVYDHDSARWRDVEADVLTGGGAALSIEW